MGMARMEGAPAVPSYPGWGAPQAQLLPSQPQVQLQGQQQAVPAQVQPGLPQLQPGPPQPVRGQQFIPSYTPPPLQQPTMPTMEQPQAMQPPGGIPSYTPPLIQAAPAAVPSYTPAPLQAVPVGIPSYTPAPMQAQPALPTATFVQQQMPSYTPAPVNAPVVSYCAPPLQAQPGPGVTSYVQPQMPSYTPAPAQVVSYAAPPPQVTAVVPQQEYVVQQEEYVDYGPERVFAEDTSVHVLPYYQVKEVDAFFEVCNQAIETMKVEKECLKFGFTVGAGQTGNMAFCRASFASAEGVLSHFQTLETLLKEGLCRYGELLSLQIHGPRAELDKLEADPMIREMNAEMYELLPGSFITMDVPFEAPGYASGPVMQEAPPVVMQQIEQPQVQYSAAPPTVQTLQVMQQATPQAVQRPMPAPVGPTYAAPPQVPTYAAPPAQMYAAPPGSSAEMPMATAYAPQQVPMFQQQPQQFATGPSGLQMPLRVM